MALLRDIDQGGITGVCVAQKSSKTLVACFPNNMRPGLSQICTGVNLPHEGRQTFKNNNSDGSVTAFHCVVTDERFYVCAAKPDVSLGICYNFLADVQEEDQKGLESGDDMLGSLLEKWNKLAKVNMDQIESIVITNIDKAGISGEKLDELEMRAADIADSADGFRASAEELKTIPAVEEKSSTTDPTLITAETDPSTMAETSATTDPALTTAESGGRRIHSNPAADTILSCLLRQKKCFWIAICTGFGLCLLTIIIVIIVVAWYGSPKNRSLGIVPS